MAKYFQGSTVTGQVQESPARDFREVVESLQFCPQLPLSRASFLALDEGERNKAKQVPFFVPATFKSSPSPRKTEHALHCNLIFLDIDPEKEKREGKWVETGRYPAARFVQNPELITKALRKFNFAAHLTASSTPEKPRMRIIVDASEIPLAEYAKAVATIGALLGLPSITRESLVAVQPMFFPVVFRCSPDDYSPVIATNLEGRPFVISDISDSLDSFHGVNGTNGANGKNGNHHTPRPQPNADPSPDALEFLRAPVPEINLAITKEALFSIEPDLSYHQWLDMAAALRHQFSPHKEEEAYQLFDEWSKQGAKYKGEKETREKWKSFQPSPAGRLPITIRSLLKLALESGWDDRHVKQTLFSNQLRWLEEVPSLMDLMEAGVRRIVGTPLLTSMQEDILIGTLCAQAKKRFAHTISSTSVRKDIARLRIEIKSSEGVTEKPREAKWAKDVCYIIAADEFYRHRTGEKIKTQAFDAAYSRWLLPTADQLIAAGTPVNPSTLSTPIVPPSKYALNFIKIPQAQDYAYDPSQPNDRWFVNGGSRFMNTYNATYPEADPKNAAWAGALLMNHLEHLIAEPELRRTVIDFMAFNVQAPGRKIRWAILLQSVEGAGKTFLAEVMKAVLGAEHVKTIDGASIKSGWNEWSFGKQLVVLEEVKVSGTNKHEIMNSLKPLITNDDISVNERFRNNRQVRNISNYMIFSNHHDALALTPGDRRYFVIKSPLQTKAQVLALGDNYFPPLYAMLRDHAGALRQWFLDWEISPDFRPDGHAPRTKYVQDMVNDSASDLTAAIRRLLLEGDHSLVQYDIVSATKLKEALYQEEGFHKVTAQAIAQILREEGLHQVGRHLIGTDRHYLWARSGISEADAVKTAAERVKKNLTNLGMEILY